MAEKSRSDLNTLIDKPYKKGNETLADKLKAIVESAPNKLDEPGGGSGLSESQARRISALMTT